jgi:SAM-dependent methyltransferase
MNFPRDSLPPSLILQHESFIKILEGRLLNAPVVEPIVRVLDIGTGCGIWAAEFATEHPTTEVIGIDVFPQPTIAAPRNCHFTIQDAEEDWKLGDAKFDIIHTRLVPFHAKEVPAVLRRCYEHLNPGGYIEMQESWPPCRTDEPPGAPEHNSKVIEWTKLRLEAASKIGIDQAITGRLPEALSEAGFVELQSHDYKWPVGPWMED